MPYASCTLPVLVRKGKCYSHASFMPHNRGLQGLCIHSGVALCCVTTRTIEQEASPLVPGRLAHCILGVAVVLAAHPFSQ